MNTTIIPNQTMDPVQLEEFTQRLGFTPNQTLDETFLVFKNCGWFVVSPDKKVGFLGQNDLLSFEALRLSTLLKKNELIVFVPERNLTHLENLSGSNDQLLGAIAHGCCGLIRMYRPAIVEDQSHNIYTLDHRVQFDDLFHVKAIEIITKNPVEFDE